MTPHKTTVIHQGAALFPNSRAYMQGILENRQPEKELAAAVSDARSKVNARRTSFPMQSDVKLEGSTTKT